VLLFWFSDQNFVYIPKHGWEDNIRTDLKEIGSEIVALIHLAQDNRKVTWTLLVEATLDTCITASTLMACVTFGKAIFTKNRKSQDEIFNLMTTDEPL